MLKKYFFWIFDVFLYFWIFLKNYQNMSQKLGSNNKYTIKNRDREPVFEGFYLVIYMPHESCSFIEKRG